MPLIFMSLLKSKGLLFVIIFFSWLLESDFAVFLNIGHMLGSVSGCCSHLSVGIRWDTERLALLLKLIGYSLGKNMCQVKSSEYLQAHTPEKTSFRIRAFAKVKPIGFYKSCFSLTYILHCFLNFPLLLFTNYLSCCDYVLTYVYWSLHQRASQSKYLAMC